MFMRILGAVMSRVRKVGKPVLVVAAVLVTFGAVHAATAAQNGQRIGPGPDPTPIYSRQPYDSGYGPQPTPSSSLPDSQKPEVQLALRFTAAWLDTSGPSGKPDKAAWLARMSPITNPTFLDGLATTDLANVPQGKLAGFVKLTPTRHSDAWVQVHTTAGDFLVFSARRNMSDQWWINSIEPVGSTAGVK